MLCDMFDEKKFDKTSKYFLWYIKLIETRTKFQPEDITEKHHIVPKCILATDKVVCLTPREHYIAHLLLYKFAKSKRVKFQMANAISKFAQNNKWQNRSFSAKDYNRIRNFAKIKSYLWWTKEKRQIRSSTMKEYWNDTTKREDRSNLLKMQHEQNIRPKINGKGENNVHNKFSKSELEKFLILMREGWTPAQLSKVYNHRKGFFSELKKTIGTTEFYTFDEKLMNDVRNIPHSLSGYKNMNPLELYDYYNKHQGNLNMDMKKSKYIEYLVNNNSLFKKEYVSSR